MRKFFQNFMQGRYGTDKLSLALLFLGVAFSILSFIFSWFFIFNILFILLSYVCLLIAILRCFSRNTYKRYRENRKYLMFLDRIKDREHRYYDCPRCRQPVRVPRGKGKIAITCPKCREKFIRKT